MACVRRFLPHFAALVLLAWFSGTANAQSASAPRASQAAAPNDGSVLPFPNPPMAGKDRASPARLHDAVARSAAAPSQRRAEYSDRLARRCGFRHLETFGGDVHTPTFDRLAKEGIRYNEFHTTSICSPSRAALLTGRNHTQVGSGTIAERAVAFDGYTGVIPKTAATIAEVLKNYGYHTAAFGKWHNTPVIETTAIGPKGSLAERLRLRIFLRVPRWRDVAVRAAAHRKTTTPSNRPTIRNIT